MDYSRQDPSMTQPSAPPPPPLAEKPDWMPRMWEGCDFFTWRKLLFRKRFSVYPRQWYIAVIMTFVCFTNTMLRLLQDAIYVCSIRKVKIEQPRISLLAHSCTD